MNTRTMALQKMNSDLPVIIVAGPTASGKSALGADIAAHFGGTVINADSMQVYRELPILSAAPNSETRERVPHRLFGVIGASQPYSAGHWRSRALDEIEAARNQGRLPVVAGGTGLYLRSLMTGLARIPPVPDGIRVAVRDRLAVGGAAALHKELARRDPAIAEKLSPGDGQRIARALEVLEATGRSIGDWHGSTDEMGTKSENLRFFTILMMPPREALYAACDSRFEDMLAAGAAGEAGRLAEAGLDPTVPAMKALGLRELLLFNAGEISLEEACLQGQQATRRYAKRQMTWFRHQMTPDFLAEEKYSESLASKIFSYISNNVLTSRG